MTRPKATISFTKAKHAASYEIHVNFIYFEVDRGGRVVKIDSVVKNITPRVGEIFNTNSVGDLMKEFPLTFYEDIAAQLKPNDDVIRYVGKPGSNGACLSVNAWGAGESMIKFLVSNQPSGSFAQINTLYTNMTVPTEDGLAFGFLSSKVKAPAHPLLQITATSEKELISGDRTKHLGFRPYTEYRP